MRHYRVCGSVRSESVWEQEPFIWQDGTMTPLGTLGGGKTSHATAISERGQIVGWATTKTGQRHAVLWTLRGGWPASRRPADAAAQHLTAEALVFCPVCWQREFGAERVDRQAESKRRTPSLSGAFSRWLRLATALPGDDYRVGRVVLVDALDVDVAPCACVDAGAADDRDVEQV